MLLFNGILQHIRGCVGYHNVITIQSMVSNRVDERGGVDSSRLH